MSQQQGPGNMQSTEPLLQELLRDVLGHQRAGKKRAQWSGLHPVPDDLNAETDAKIAKAVIFMSYYT